MRVLSGIQPSGRLHIGNYFGALRQHLALQEDNECLYFMASYHALTTVQDPGEMRQNTLDVALDYLTLGLDPTRTLLFRQQDVPEVTELTWIFSCVTPMGLLERAHSYKDKVGRGIMPNVGLFSYPILAADILIYRLTWCRWAGQTTHRDRGTSQPSTVALEISSSPRRVHTRRNGGCTRRGRKEDV